MSDLISRQAAIDAIEQIFDRCEEIEAHLPEGDPDRTGYKMYPDYITVWKYLHQLPSAQPEIIRCKDCRFAHLTYDGDCKYCQYLADEFDLTDAVYFDGNDYCSHAERRTDGMDS